jgi:alpha-L-fucosidase
LLAGAARAADAPLDKWSEMRFGMFIHWGPVGLKGTEIGWSRGAQVSTTEYDQLYKKFNPVKFNAAAWVGLAREAGMKYLVITTKHHDGFCLWPSKLTEYHIGNTPFKRDVLRDLADECKKQGIVFSTYYSVCDWYHPDYGLGSPGGSVKKPKPNMDRYAEYLRGQTQELVANYGPLGVMWFDIGHEDPWKAEYGVRAVAELKKLQPSLIVNDRCRGYAGDYYTPEQRVGGFDMDRRWESCITICQQWSWKPDDRLKTLPECVRTLARCAGGDGNLLLNISPMPDGSIESRQAERLREIGAWLGKHGESIYGTRGGPFKPGRWGVSTRKGNTVYLHVFEWEAGGITVPAMGLGITGCRVLTGGTAELKPVEEGMRIEVSQSNRSDIDTVLALELDGPADTIKPRTLGTTLVSLTAGAKVTSSNVYRTDPTWGPEKAVDGDETTRWATDTGTSAAWLEADFGEPRTIGSVFISECVDYGQRVGKFEIQVKEGDGWKKVLEGGAIGPIFKAKIRPVTARQVRLAILSATEGPTIWEFELFAPEKANKGGTKP